MAVGLGTGGDDEEGDAGGLFEEAALVPEVVLAEVPAVIGGEDDDGVVGELEAIEGGENAASLGIDITDAGEIAADGGTSLLRRGSDVIAGNGNAAGGEGNVGFIVGGLVRKRDFVEGVEVEVFGGGDERQVRAVKADGEEEGLVLVALFEPLDGGFGERAIDEVVVGCCVFVPGDALLAAGFDLYLADAGGREGAFVFEGSAEIPGFGIVHAFEAAGDAEVEDFSAAGGGIAVLAEEARERHDAGNIYIEVVFVVGDARGIGTEAAEERRTRGIAVRKLAIGTLEEDAALREGVEMRRFGLGMSVAAQVGGEVVGHEEDDVGTGGRLGCCRLDGDE